MKYLSTAFILFLFFSIKGLCQNIEVPETVITGKDRAIYKTPLFFYQYDVQIKFPEIKKIQIPPTVTNQGVSQEKVEAEKEKILAEFSIFAGKFGQIYSDFILRSAEIDASLSLSNDESFRTNDSKRIIDFSLKKRFNSEIFFGLDYRRSEKEMPGSIYQPLDRQKQTNIIQSSISFLNQNFNAEIKGSYNSLNRLEEKEVLLTFKKYYKKFILGGDLGYNDFAGEGNKILTLSGIYKNETYELGMEVKTIGDQTRLLPSATITTEKNIVKFSAGILGNFSFPDFWEKSGDSSYLNIKNAFLQPEEKYSIYSMLIFRGVDMQLVFNGKAAYEKTSYQWKDINNDNIYQPVIIKNNMSTSYGISIMKRIGQSYIETGFTHTIWEKQPSGFPEETGYINMGFGSNKFKQEIQLNYTGPQRFDTTKISSHTVVSVLLSYNIKPDMTLLCMFGNILGTKYQQAPEYPGRPFEVVAGFHVKW